MKDSGRTSPNPSKPSGSDGAGPSTAGSRWLVGLAVVGYLAVGVFPYSVSGLLVPPAGLIVLLACWAIGLVAMVLLARHRPIVAPAAVVGAIVFWFAYVTIGSALFGWTA